MDSSLPIHTDAVIIEPRLRGPAGHYLELARAIVAGADHGSRFTLAVASAGLAHCDALRPTDDRGIVVDTVPFDRVSIGAEAALAVSHAENGRSCLLLTAKGAHAFALSLTRATGEPLSRIALLFHWPSRSFSDRAMHAFGVAARRHCLALATTHSVGASLRSLGWQRVREVPYPMLALETSEDVASFSHVLLAGPLRTNKGLEAVARLIKRWSQSGGRLPIRMHTTPKRGVRHGRREQILLDKIVEAGCPGVEFRPNPEDRCGYISQFRGAITLVAYDPKVFADQVSGVSLDAILNGSPIVATEGMLAAELVQEFGCGEVVRFGDTEQLDAAIARIATNWEHYSRAVEVARRVIRDRHSSRHFHRAWQAQSAR